MKFLDRTNHVYGYLTVLSFAEKRKGRNWWNCECKCGNHILVNGSSLKTGNTKSCGCFRKELTSRRYLKHGYACQKIRIPEYSVWQNMINRCHRQGSSSYKYYGARGITVCSRWRYSFTDFLEDMGRRPSKKHSIDRIDVNGCYEVFNCKWATQKEQVANRRVKLIENFSTIVIDQEYFKRHPNRIPTIW